MSTGKGVGRKPTLTQDVLMLLRVLVGHGCTAEGDTLCTEPDPADRCASCHAADVLKRLDARARPLLVIDKALVAAAREGQRLDGRFLWTGEPWRKPKVDAPDSVWAYDICDAKSNAVATCYACNTVEGRMGGGDIEVTEALANRDRIIACVNALAHVEDPIAAIASVTATLVEEVDALDVWLTCDGLKDNARAIDVRDGMGISRDKLTRALALLGVHRD